MPIRPKPDLPTEEMIDAAIELSFPASDPPAYGCPTGTEPPTQPTDRRSPLPTRRDLAEFDGLEAFEEKERQPQPPHFASRLLAAVITRFAVLFAPHSTNGGR